MFCRAPQPDPSVPAPLQPPADLPPADAPEAAFDWIAAANSQPAVTLSPTPESEEPEEPAEDGQEANLDQVLQEDEEAEEKEEEEEIPLNEVPVKDILAVDVRMKPCLCGCLSACGTFFLCFRTWRLQLRRSVLLRRLLRFQLRRQQESP